MKTPMAADILIVEDNPNDLELALRALGKRHLHPTIVTLGDGAEAVDYLFAQGAYADRPKAQHPRVIFLDLKLPKITGIEVLRRIKADESTRSIPVVILTSSQQESDVQECYRHGVNSYIVKPVDYGKFSEVIGDLSRYWLALNHSPR